MKTIEVTPTDDIQRLLDALDEPAEILLHKGIYRQKIKIARGNITIKGESRDETIISWDDYARKRHADGMEYNTFRTYTVCVTGENVRLENFTIENSVPDPKTAGQCVALSVNAKTFSAADMRPPTGRNRPRAAMSRRLVFSPRRGMRRFRVRNPCAAMRTKCGRSLPCPLPA